MPTRASSGRSRRAPAWAACALIVMTAALAQAHAQAQSSDGSFSNPARFVPRDGEVLYRTACQACHMPAAQGAVGAGTYPALASDQKLRTASFPVGIVVNGSRAMPPFRDLLDDEQVVAVVNYVRTHFGNQYRDTVSAADVKTARSERR